MYLEPHSPPTIATGAKRGDGDTGVFMVQRCAVHSSGALLLEPSDGDAYDARLQARQGAPAAPVAPPTQPGNNAMDDMAMDGNWGGAGDVHHDGGDLPMWDHDGGAHDDDDDHDQGGYMPPNDAHMDANMHGMRFCGDIPYTAYNTHNPSIPQTQIPQQQPAMLAKQPHSAPYNNHKSPMPPSTHTPCSTCTKQGPGSHDPM